MRGWLYVFISAWGLRLLVSTVKGIPRTSDCGTSYLSSLHAFFIYVEIKSLIESITLVGTKGG